MWGTPRHRHTPVETTSPHMDRCRQRPDTSSGCPGKVYATGGPTHLYWERIPSLSPSGPWSVTGDGHGDDPSCTPGHRKSLELLHPHQKTAAAPRTSTSFRVKHVSGEASFVADRDRPGDSVSGTESPWERVGSYSRGKPGHLKEVRDPPPLTPDDNRSSVTRHPEVRTRPTCPLVPNRPWAV